MHACDWCPPPPWPIPPRAATGIARGWPGLTQAAVGGRGAAGEYVASLRTRAESARLPIMGALAANHLARKEPARAIPLLKRALERPPDREDVARNLRAAYLENGQLAKTSELRKEHALEG